MTAEEHLAAAPFADAHEGIVTFRSDKVQEMDARLAEHCRCRAFPHTFDEVHLALEVCEFAKSDPIIECQDAMAYMLEDLHDTVWYEHHCFDPKTS